MNAAMVIRRYAVARELIRSTDTLRTLTYAGRATPADLERIRQLTLKWEAYRDAG